MNVGKGDRVPRPHDQRRDKLPGPVASSSGSASSGQRPSSSGNPHSHGSRPPDGSHHHRHHTSSRPHPEKPIHPHQRPSSSIKDTKQPSNSTISTHPPSSVQQQPRVQQQHHPQHPSSQVLHNNSNF